MTVVVGVVNVAATVVTIIIINIVTVIAMVFRGQVVLLVLQTGNGTGM